MKYGLISQNFYLLKPGAQARCKRNKLWVQFPLQEIKYSIFSFCGSGNEDKGKNLAESWEWKYLNGKGVS